MEERRRQYEESIQNKVLTEYIRIINIPIGDHKEFNLMCDDFLARVGLMILLILGSLNIQQRLKEGIKEPEIRIKRAKIKVEGLGSFDPIVLALRLKMDCAHWNGSPFEELLDFKLQKEYKEETMHISELHLPGLGNKENLPPEASYLEAVVGVA
ncbi:unnamed protein product [Cylicocyclus nassatus]|uniref:Uncharacterized protein n=1 Tax=Cylicocyclus nassatus TaxID=53992 RepID=A0AA36HD64_CYLNA|nr:unnamed protein product [Cylicocyclus nassatus]